MAQSNKRVPIRTETIMRDNQTYNRYYMHISSRFCAAKWITLLLFTVYLAGMLVAGRSSITHENFLYLMRDFNISSSASGAYASVVYEEQQNMSFSVFKNTLAVAGSSGVRLYDAAGNSVFRDSVSYKTPVLLTGDKYMLLYDEGGREYSLLTTLARVSGGTMEGDILCASISDGGQYAIVSRSSESKYVIDVFNASFKNIERIYRDSYVTGIALDEGGENIAILSSRSDDWTLKSEISFLRIGSDDARTVSLGERLPLYCRYMIGGNLAVVCDSSFMIVSSEGNVLADVSLSPMTLSMFDVSDRLAAVVCSENVLGNTNRILVYNFDGVSVMDTAVDKRVSSVTASDVHDGVYISYGSTVEYITKADARSVQFVGSLVQVCEVEGRAVLCFPGGASSADFN